MRGVRQHRERHEDTIRYEGLDSDFSAELTFDADGLVIDYPGLGHRVG